MMSIRTKGLLESFLYKEFYEMYDFYLTDLEFSKRYPELSNKVVSEHYKEDCDEIVVALSELCEISFEEAEDRLKGFYSRKKMREQKKKEAC